MTSKSATFPVTFLEQLVPYLEPHDASALARTCRKHLAICYLMAVDVLGWKLNHMQRFGHMSKKTQLPTDQFIQTQIAKIALVSNSIHVQKGSSRYNILDFHCLENLLEYSTQTQPYPFTLKYYFHSVVFKTNFDGEYDVRDPISKLCFQVIIGHFEAKILYAISTSNYALYCRLNDMYRPKDKFMSMFLRNALATCTQNESRFVLAELKYAVELHDEDNWIHTPDPEFADVLSDHFQITKDREVFENPEIMIFMAQYNSIMYVVRPRICRIVLDNDNGLDRCKRLVDIGALDQKVLKTILLTEPHVFYDPDLDVYWSYMIEHLHRLVQYEPIKAEVLRHAEIILDFLNKNNTETSEDEKKFADELEKFIAQNQFELINK